MNWHEFFRNEPTVNSLYVKLCCFLGDLLTKFTPLTSTVQMPLLDKFAGRIKSRLDNCVLEKERAKLTRQLARVALRRRRFEELSLNISSAKDFFAMLINV